MNIPNNLEEALSELEDLFPDKEKEFITSNPESCMIQYHHGAGRWIRNNWKLWAKEDSNLKTWFKEKGITHPDDMSGIILNSYWRAKNNKDINLDQQIKSYQDYWEKLKEEIPKCVYVGDKCNSNRCPKHGMKK